MHVTINELITAIYKTPSLSPMYTVAQKVNHYKESLLNRIKREIDATFFINYKHIMSTKYYNFVLNILCVTYFVTSEMTYIVSSGALNSTH